MLTIILVGLIGNEVFPNHPVAWILYVACAYGACDQFFRAYKKEKELK